MKLLENGYSQKKSVRITDIEYAALMFLTQKRKIDTKSCFSWESGIMLYKYFYLSLKRDVLISALKSPNTVFKGRVFASRFLAVACDYATGVIEGADQRVKNIILEVECQPYEEKYGKLVWSAHTCLLAESWKQRLRSLKTLKMGVRLNGGASKYLWNAEFYEALLPVFSLAFASRIFVAERDDTQEMYNVGAIIQRGTGEYLSGRELIKKFRGVNG